MQYDKLKKYRNDMLKIIVIFAFGTGILTSLVSVLNHRPMNNIVISLICSVFLAIIYLKNILWNSNNIIRIVVILIFSFIYLPIQWYASAGIAGSITYYTLLVIVIVTFFLEKPWELIFPVGIIIEVLIFFQVQVYYPNFFHRFDSQNQQITDLSYNFIIVASMFLLVIYFVNRTVEEDREELYKLSITDELTKVYNRRFLIESLEKIISQSEKQNDEFIIFFIDINKFKNINDTMGHQIGDIVLIELGSVIHQCLKSCDVCGRYGGDEFMIILPFMDLETSEFVAERISSQFTHSIQEKIKIKSSITIGISSGKGKTINDIIKEADNKMYEKKFQNLR